MGEPDFDPIAAFDQGEKSMKEMARVHAAYYEALTERRVPEETARAMVVATIEAFFRQRGLLG